MTVDYAKAERFLPHNREKLVFGDRVEPQWLADGDRFTYLSRRRTGKRFLLVNPAEGSVTPAFDHERLAKSLAAASGAAVDPGDLPFESVELDDKQVGFEVDGERWTCDLGDYTCTSRGHRPGLHETPSPDGKWVAFVREHNLWVREIVTGAEHRLTGDGTADFAYAKCPDASSPRVLFERLGVQGPPMLLWSPDSRRIATHRLDTAGLPSAYLIDAAPLDGGRPRLRTSHYPVPGDAKVPTAELVVVSVPHGTLVRSEGAPLHAEYVPPEMAGMAWSEKGDKLYYYDTDRFFRRLSLYELDAATGDVRLLAEDHHEKRVDGNPSGGPPISRVLSNGDVVWFSQRDGWGHLYLYAAEGGEPVRLTSGEWVVKEILHVDEKNGTVLFAASGHVAGDPYPRQIFSAGLDGTGLTRLTDDVLDHAAVVSPSGKYLVDVASFVDVPPVTSVRNLAGEVVVELEVADVGDLVALGWRGPERVRVRAADGVTEIYGTLFFPLDFDPGRSYPVVEHVYPGPQIHRVAPGFGDPSWSEVFAVAALGFIVVTLDGRGTPGRSKAFHDESYGRMGEAGATHDHVAGITELAATRPYMDLTRVGVFGHSGGGYAAARSILAHPDFYHVGVASSGNHENDLYCAGWAELYQGPYDKELYQDVNNSLLAHRLKGKLFLVHGDGDDNVFPYHTMRLVDALIRAGKDFDLLLIPGAEHGLFGYEGYVAKRTWDYFVRHLHGVEPPADHPVPDVPLDRQRLIKMLG
ncbi:S9 family peptidase [Sinosporangium siamense]|uniref:Dipeptidyl peptidase IV n=1 Tax=Sinosporangium siamense TaxID=1367973 RepID=A0A919VAH5_9ACTN|nr:DPP IV N-terminal domain-containing protein [Sinosporangium siamense]GII95417.1 putative dipeptidyl peptidase IV [Sinosporangium siamense]